MLGLAITGGEGPAPEALREIALKADVIAAADSGLIAAEAAGLRPDWVLGDMDSLGIVSRGSAASLKDGLSLLEKYPPDRVLRYPPDKDFTDTELALALLKEKGCDEIWLSGGGGGRTDHLFAIRSLFERPLPPDRWFTANEEIFCLKEGKTLKGCQALSGLPVSVFPLGDGPWEAESEGLKWPLKGLPWERGFFGLSNEAPGGAYEIHSIKGRFLVIVSSSVCRYS